MIAAQLNTLCAAYQNVTKVGLATGDPGPAGTSNDSGITKATIAWSTPTGGSMTATATFSDITGTFTHITFWAGSTFIEAKPRSISMGSAADLVLAVEHTVTG